MTHPGPPGRPVLRPAGIVTRMLAAVVDAAAVGTALGALYLGAAGLVFLWSPTAFAWPLPTRAFSVVAAGLLATSYLTVSWATTGRTCGAALLGLRVLSGRGIPLGWPRAGVRAVLCLLFPIGLLWSGASPGRRSVQDALLRSTVVYDERPDGGVRPGAAG